MPATKSLPLVQVGEQNVDATSFFCMQSKSDNPGHKRKRKWLEKRFDEGLQIRMLGQRDATRWNGERGFIEYIPSPHAWRAIEAEDYMVIHCLWVVGKSRGKGCAAALLEECTRDARRAGLGGIATVTAENGFAVGRKFYEHHGFEAVAQADPRIHLMVRRLKKRAPSPTFSTGALRGPAHYTRGLTILRTDQCPYIDDATAGILKLANERDIAPVRCIQLKSAADVRRRAPTPYGVFSTVLDGQLLSYRYLTAKEFDKAVARVRA